MAAATVRMLYGAPVNDSYDATEQWVYSYRARKTRQ